MPEQSELSTELRLLAACDLAPDGRLAEAYGRALAAGLDWARFADLVVCHGVGGLVGARLMPLAGGSMPHETAELLTGRMRLHAAAGLANTAETVRLVRHLDKHGIRSLVLKGAALAHTLYAPRPEWRYSSDIDLLVDPRDFIAADRRLQEAGYRRTDPDWEPEPRSMDMLLLLMNHFSYRHAERDNEVELHHRMTLNPHWLMVGFDEAWAGSAEVDTGSGRFRSLDGPLLLSYLSWHALGHPGFRLKWFSDVARAWGRTSAGRRQAIDEECRRLGAEKPVALALSVASRLYARTDAVPHLSRSATVSAGQIAAIIGALEAGEDMPTERRLAGLPSEFGRALFLSGLSPRLAAKSYSLSRLFVDPRDVSRLGLGRRWAWLYVLLGPSFAALRYLRLWRRCS